MKQLLFYSFIFLLLISCKNGQAQEKAVETITVEAAKKLINESPGLQILDVRTPGEVSNGIVPGAIVVDINNPEFLKEVATKVDKSKPILVYCKAGTRSKKACGMMEGQGYTKLYNLDGGYDAWSK
jgi:rhodanese-related sulfurtransferase